MDWTKAKTILIIALIVTDFFLVGACIQKEDNRELKNEKALLHVLEENEIYVDLPRIPEKHGDMPTLFVEYRVIPDAEKARLFEDASFQVSGTEDADYTDIGKRLLEELNLSRKEIGEGEIQRQEDGSVRVVFGCTAGDKELAGSSITFVFREGRLTAIDNSLFLPQEFSEKKLRTISAAAALINFMAEREERETVHIAGMKLVYWINRDFYESVGAVSDTALPAWKITLADGRNFYVEALEK